MAGIGTLIKAVGRLGGRVLGRVAGPLGAAVTIGELGYLGLKYSGTLEKFKSLYCEKCRSEISMSYLEKIGARYDVGVLFTAACPSCRQEHALTKVHLLCENCKTYVKDPKKERKIAVPNQANYLFLTCPQCNKPLKFVKNRSG